MNSITPHAAESAPQPPIIRIPHAQPREHEPRRSILTRLSDMRFVSVSLFIHAFIVLFGGSIVLVSKVVDTPDFVAGDGKLIDPGEAGAPQPPGEPAPPDVPEFKPPTPPISAPATDAITAANNLTTYQVNAAPASVKTDTIATALANATKGMEGKLAGLSGGGMRGGTNAFFGMRETKENKGIGLTGYFYDAKQTRGRKPTNMDVNQFSVLISKFAKEGWKESTLNEYYKAPNALTTTQIFIPNMPADEGPKAFDVEKEVQPSRWLVHYRGKISPPHDGNYRFVGAGDDYLVVRLNNKVVLDQGFAKATDWKPEKFYNYGFTGVPNGFARGDKFHAVAGQFYDIEILISERPGGLVFFCLMMEDQDMEYAKDAKGNPILPVFRLADGPMPEPEKGQTFPPYDPKAPIWKSQPYRGGSAFDQAFGAKDK